MTDFGIDACWTFTATAHGKGPCDGLGASVKSTATRSIIRSGVFISTAEELYNFTVQFNEKAAATTPFKQPPIHAVYVTSAMVENVYNTVLKPRWEAMNKTGKKSN